MTTRKVSDRTEPKVSDLTVAEFRELIREVVTECLAEMYEDFHPGLELSDEFAAKLQASLDSVAAGEPTVPAEEIAKRLGLKW